MFRKADLKAGIKTRFTRNVLEAALSETAILMRILERLDVMDISYERHGQRAPRARGAMSRANRTGRVKREGYFCGIGRPIALWRPTIQGIQNTYVIPIAKDKALENQ